MLYINHTVDLIKKVGVGGINREVLSEHLGIAPGSFAHCMGESYSAFMGKVAAHVPLGLFGPKGGSQRMIPALRRRQLLAGAVALSKKHCYWGISAQMVADWAGVSKPNFARLYTIAELRKDVVLWAIENQDQTILAQAKSANDPILKG